MRSAKMVLSFSLRLNELFLYHPRVRCIVGELFIIQIFGCVATQLHSIEAIGGIKVTHYQ